MDCSEIRELNDCEQVFVYGATVSTLCPFIDPEVPWIWVSQHTPVETIRWWKSTAPLNEVAGTFTGKIRNLAYDILMPTSSFLSKVADFERHGIVLVQSEHPIPDTLQLHSIPDAQLRAVLIQNRVTLKVYLPHAAETAFVESYVPGRLAEVLGSLN